MSSLLRGDGLNGDGSHHAHSNGLSPSSSAGGGGGVSPHKGGGGGGANGHHTVDFADEGGLAEEQRLLILEKEQRGDVRKDESAAARAKRESRAVRFLCFDLSFLSMPVLFALLSAGVIGFFILNSFLEEFLFKALKDFKFGWYMTAFELMCFTGFAIIERYMRGTEPVWSHIAHYRSHMWVAFCMTMSRGLTNKSLEYLNYPTQVIFKSMKLITVMIGSIFILRQRFSVLEYVSAVALVLSAILFSLGDVAETPEVTSTLGFIIVILSLVADAMHSNTQEQLLKEYRATVLEAMLYTNMFAAVMSWGVVIFIGELQPAAAYCSDYPLAYLLFVLRAGVIYLGVLCFVLMINTFGVVRATAVTTVRKILTIVVSFILFPKPISGRHVWGFLIFAAGISLGIWDKQREMAQKEKIAAMQAAAAPDGKQPAGVVLVQMPSSSSSSSNGSRSNGQ